MAEAKNSKDIWDKLEIFGKVALPVVVAGATLWFNSQVNERQLSADMVSIAVGVLSKEVEEAGSDDVGVDPLRQWAVEVLDNPAGVHELTETAKSALVSGTSTLSRAESVLSTLDGLALLRISAQEAPFPSPVKETYSVDGLISERSGRDPIPIEGNE